MFWTKQSQFNQHENSWHNLKKTNVSIPKAKRKLQLVSNAVSLDFGSWLRGTWSSQLSYFDGSFPVALIINISSLHPVRRAVFTLILIHVTFGVINSSCDFYFWLWCLMKAGRRILSPPPANTPCVQRLMSTTEGNNILIRWFLQSQRAPPNPPPCKKKGQVLFWC